MTTPDLIFTPTLTQGHTLNWSPGTTYQPNMNVIDRGGIWLCLVENKGSQPISGNTDWMPVAGTPYVDVDLSPTVLTTPPFFDAGETGPGLVVIPAAGAGLLVLPTQMTERVGVGTAWGSDASLTVAYDAAGGPTTPISDMPPGDDLSAVTPGPFWWAINSVTDLEPADTNVVNKPLVVYTTVDVSSGGTGTRHLFLRIWYQILGA